MAACLAGGDKAAASHLAAAGLYDAEQVLRGQLEMTTFDGRSHQIPGVRTHRSSIDFATAVQTHLNLPVVVPGLTVVQLARTCHPHLVKSVANDLVKRHWTTWQDIVGWLENVGDGRRGQLRELCERALAVGGHDDSPPARVLCEMLEKAGITGIELDFELVTLDCVRHLDIAIPRHRVALEYNGQKDHDGPLAQSEDGRRRACITAMDWLIFDVNRHTPFEDAIRWTKAAISGRLAH